MTKNKIFFDERFDFTKLVLDKDKTIELIPIKNNDILDAYNRFTLGSKITGLNGYKEWKQNVLGTFQYKIDEKIAIAQPYADIYDDIEYIKDLKGFNDRRYTSYDKLKNFIKIKQISLCKINELPKNEYLSFGIKKGCYFDNNAFSFKTNFYYTYNKKVNTFDTIEDAYFSLSEKICKKKTDLLFYKIEFELA